MKKIPIFLLILITCATINLLVPLKTEALYVDDSGTTWWSVEDLLEFSKIAEAEEEALCGDDFDCRNELFFSKFESEDMRYQALEMLKEGRFWITAVNPTAETIEVLYFDEDEMLKRWGYEEIQPLEFIFIAWFDSINGEIGNYNHELPIEPQFSDDLHLLYADSAEPFDEEGFPADKPFGLPINSTNLIDNYLGYLYIATFGENYNSKGYLDYSDCLEDYREGETCKLMFSPGNGYKFLSPREKTIENEQNENNDEGNDGELTGLGEVTYIEAQTPGEENETVSFSVPEAPNTGNYTGACEKVVEFPWWLTIILVLGNITALWLFLPSKSHKNLKKALDKDSGVR